MITIPVRLSNELAKRVQPFQDRLPEIIELGLRQITAGREGQADYPQANQRALDALTSTGIVTLPTPAAHRKARARRTPIQAGGPPASALVIAERRGEL